MQIPQRCMADVHCGLQEMSMEASAVLAMQLLPQARAMAAWMCCLWHGKWNAQQQQLLQEVGTMEAASQSRRSSVEGLLLMHQSMATMVDLQQQKWHQPSAPDSATVCEMLLWASSQSPFELFSWITCVRR